FLLRAHRSTLPRKYYSRTIESETMFVKRRISASFKDIPGGQILGSTYDYTHRLLNFDLIDETKEDMKSWIKEFQQQMELPTTEQKELIYFPKVVDYLRKEG